MYGDKYGSYLSSLVGISLAMSPDPWYRNRCVERQLLGIKESLPMYIAMRIEDYSYCLWIRPLFTADVPHACAAGEMDACVCILPRGWKIIHIVCGLDLYLLRMFLMRVQLEKWMLV